MKVQVKYPKSYLIKKAVRLVYSYYRLYNPAKGIEPFQDVENNPKTFIEKVLKGKITYKDFKNSSIDYKIIHTKESFKIVLNSLYKDKDLTYILGCSIGHLFLHMGYLFNSDRWNNLTEYTFSPIHRQGFQEEEYEAKLFCYEYLMPEDLYKEAIEKELLKNNGNSEINTDCPAEKFKVPVKLFIERGVFLGYEFLKV